MRRNDKHAFVSQAKQVLVIVLHVQWGHFNLAPNVHTAKITHLPAVLSHNL